MPPRRELASDSDDALAATFGAVVREEGTSGDVTPERRCSDNAMRSPFGARPTAFAALAGPMPPSPHAAALRASRALARAQKQLRYSQQVALVGAYDRLAHAPANNTPPPPSSAEQPPAAGRVTDAEGLTAAWRGIRHSEEQRIRALAADAALGGGVVVAGCGAAASVFGVSERGSTSGGGRLPPSVFGTSPAQLASSLPSAMASADGIAAVLAALTSSAPSPSASASAPPPAMAMAMGAPSHAPSRFDESLLLIIRQLAVQQEDLAMQLREARAQRDALLHQTQGLGQAAGAPNGACVVSSSSAEAAGVTAYGVEWGRAPTESFSPPVDAAEATVRPPPLLPGGPLDGSVLASYEGAANDAFTSIASSTSRGIITALREQAAQAHQREADWRRQVNALQLMVDDAREEAERAAAEHREEVGKLQKTIDLLLQDIELDMRAGRGRGGDAEGGAGTTPSDADADAEAKVRMLRKVRSAIQRGGYASPMDAATASDDLHRRYETVLSDAIKEEADLLATSISAAAASPELLDRLQAAVRKGSMRRSHSMGAVGMAIAIGGQSPAEAASPALSDRHSSNISTSQPATPQRGSGISPRGTAPSPAPAVPAPAVFHANNPNQIGDVVPRDSRDEQWVLIEAIKAGLQAEVCKSILDHYDDSQKPSRAGPLTGIVKGLVSTVAAAASTVAATMADPTAGADITKETTEYFCHLAKDAVVTRRTLPSSLPPLKAANANKQLLHVFHSINATYAPSPAIGSAQSVGQGRLVCRGDQIRLRFFAPKCFAMIREKLGVDPEHLRLSIEQCDWRRAASPGKSEAVMFYFGDYVLKTVKNVEASFLKSTYIPAFTTYASNNPHTLLPHFMTFFSVTWLLKRQTFTFVLMKNVFSTRHYINAIYDLKGSTVGREAAREEDGGGRSEVKRTAYGALLLKDNDLPRQLIYCGPLRRAVLIAQLQADTSFLQSVNIVDYSLMVGVRSRVVSKGGSEEQRAAAYMDVNGSCIRSSNGGLLSLAIYDEHDMNTVREDTYYVGIIDCLQPYNSSKKLEHFAKGLLMYDRHKISVVPPEEYAERLCRLIDRISV